MLLVKESTVLLLCKGLQCALTAITIVAPWQLPHLGHGMCTKKNEPLSFLHYLTRQHMINSLSFYTGGIPVFI